MTTRLQIVADLTQSRVLCRLSERAKLPVSSLLKQANDDNRANNIHQGVEGADGLLSAI